MSVNGSFAQTYSRCTELSPLCPVEATVLGYKPNIYANGFFAAAFGLCALGSIGIGFWKRTWAFTTAVACGSLLEAIGYIGRVLMDENPWDKNAFQTQICAIVLAPTVICAGIYLTLKHVALGLDPSLSRVRPKFYPLFFLPADVSCLIVQAIGGGIAAAAGRTNRALLDGGNRAIIAGITLQVVVLLLFGAVSGEYLLRVKRRAKDGTAPPQLLALWHDKKFRMFLYAVTGAYTCVLFRCIYRIAEMAGGWGNHIMQDEISFMVLDASMILAASALLTVFPPGIFFPQMAGGVKRSARETKEKRLDSAGSSKAQGIFVDSSSAKA